MVYRSGSSAVDGSLLPVRGIASLGACERNVRRGRASRGRVVDVRTREVDAMRRGDMCAIGIHAFVRAGDD